jgi:hypothetical protein
VRDKRDFASLHAELPKNPLTLLHKDNGRKADTTYLIDQQRMEV